MVPQRGQPRYTRRRSWNVSNARFRGPSYYPLDDPARRPTPHHPPRRPRLPLAPAARASATALAPLARLLDRHRLDRRRAASPGLGPATDSVRRRETGARPSTSLELHTPSSAARRGSRHSGRQRGDLWGGSTTECVSEARSSWRPRHRLRTISVPDRCSDAGS